MVSRITQDMRGYTYLRGYKTTAQKLELTEKVYNQPVPDESMTVMQKSKTLIFQVHVRLLVRFMFRFRHMFPKLPKENLGKPMTLLSQRVLFRELVHTFVLILVKMPASVADSMRP